MGSVWSTASLAGEPYAALDRDIEADVVVIGGGITGLSTALRLVDEGLRVVVLEARGIGSGNTGGSTGNLYGTVSQGLERLRRKWGDAAVRQVVDARMEALSFLEETVKRFGLDCQFQRQPLCLCLTDAQSDDKLLGWLDAEYEASRMAGLPATLVDDGEVLPFPTARVLRLDQQAQFNPLRFAQGLARALAAQGVAIHEHSRVVEVDADQGLVRTDRAEVRARHIVHATHSPLGVNLVQAEMLPYREYGIAARLQGDQYPQGSFWVLDQFHSIRSYHYDGQDYLLVIGERHKTGHGEAGSGYYQRLHEYVRSRFPVAGIDYQWSAQQYVSADLLPYIGRAATAGNVYLGTGYAADGLVWGAFTGMLISDLILERDNHWQALFDPARFTPLKSAKKWLQENVGVAEHYAKDYLTPPRTKDFDEVPRGEGRVIADKGDKLAVHRDADGELTVLSAVCPHLKCLVHWNAADDTWDCPCHGSRFRVSGEVIEGPAYRGLASRGR